MGNVTCVRERRRFSETERSLKPENCDMCTRTEPILQTQCTRKLEGCDTCTRTEPILQTQRTLQPESCDTCTRTEPILQTQRTQKHDILDISVDVWQLLNVRVCSFWRIGSVLVHVSQLCCFSMNCCVRFNASAYVYPAEALRLFIQRGASMYPARRVLHFKLMAKP